MKRYPDEEVLAIIKKLPDGEGDSDDLEFWFSHQLAEFVPGISDLIFYSKRKMTAEEILKEAREKNKPILL